MFLVDWGSGSGECLLQAPYSAVDQARILGAAKRILQARGQQQAAELIDELKMSIFTATNGFADEFCALVGSGSPEEYADWVDRFSDKSKKPIFSAMSAAVTEVMHEGYIRFVALSVSSSGEVANVAVMTTSGLADDVLRALSDADVLLTTQGPGSAVDRVHTALHAYVRSLCQAHGLIVEVDDSLTTLFKRLREDSQKFAPRGLRSNEMNRILGSLAGIADAANTLRNKASGAHPNPSLEAPEAMLAINAMRSAFVYLRAKAGM